MNTPNQAPEIKHFGRSKPYEGKEDKLQESCFKWLKLSKHKHQKIFHVPNGGNRSPREGAKFKKIGVKAGVSDIIVLEPRHGHGAMILELKTKTERKLKRVPSKTGRGTAPKWTGGKMGTVSPEQKKFLISSIESGYFVGVVWNFNEFERLVNWYFEK